MVFLAGCVEERIFPKGYKFLCCNSFSVTEYAAENPKGRAVYKINPEGNLIITSIAYQASNKLLAIALTSKEPSKKTAIIKILNYKDLTLQTELATGKDRINGMDFCQRRQLVFSATDMNRNFPGELCLISLENGVQHTLATGLNFYKPSWDNYSEGVYFGYRDGNENGVAYLQLNSPKTIKKFANGYSVTVSEKGAVAYIANGEIFFAKKQGEEFKPLDLPAQYTNPKFTDSIRFVKDTEDLVLQQYKKSTVYDLLMSSPPYVKVDVVLENVGMLDYEISFLEE